MTQVDKPFAAFSPDKGESVSTPIEHPTAWHPYAELLPQDGYLSLDKDKFPASFAADVGRASRAGTWSK